MFSKLASITNASLALLAAATPTPNTPASQCSTALVQCCESSGTAGSPKFAKELGLLGVVVQDLSVLVGLGWSPISVVGVGSGATCEASPLCRENNGFGLVAVGCALVDLDL